MLFYFFFFFLFFLVCFSSKDLSDIISLKQYIKYTAGGEIRDKPNGLLSHVTRSVITMNSFSMWYDSECKQHHSSTSFGAQKRGRLFLCFTKLSKRKCAIHVNYIT